MKPWPGCVARILLPLALCIQVACATAQPSPDSYQEEDCTRGESTLCSSYHASVTNMFLALGRGDLTTAMYYLSLLTGLSVSQQQVIINGLTHFFDEGNQVVGRCGDVARGGFQSLSRLGERIGMRPYFLKIISTEGRLLGFETRSGVTKQVSDNGVHVAVKFAGRVFDAYTGPGGMEEKEYFRHLFTALGQDIAKKNIIRSLACSGTWSRGEGREKTNACYMDHSLVRAPWDVSRWAIRQGRA